MMKPSKFFTCSFALAMLASACTQEKAPVQDLGKQSYTRNGDGSYSRVYNNGSYSYSPQVQAAPSGSVGVSELPPAGQSSTPAYNNSQPYGANNSGITITNTQEQDPFKTPPSKPLDQPSQLTPQDKTLDNAAPANSMYPADTSTPVYTKDGISLIWPVNGGKVIAHFNGEANDGVNISMSEGEPIMAAASGTVVYSGNDLKDYGNMVILRHDNSWLTAYANASKIAVKKGAYVKQGDIIAYVGSSGGVKTPQLHFALRKGKVPVDPEQYLPKIGAR